MWLPSELSDVQSAAIVECIRLLAAHGRAIREAREAEQQKTKDADSMGIGAASLVDDLTTHERAVVYGQA
jgi:hypothetical protein